MGLCVGIVTRHPGGGVSWSTKIYHLNMCEIMTLCDYSQCRDKTKRPHRNADAIGIFCYCKEQPEASALNAGKYLRKLRVASIAGLSMSCRSPGTTVIARVP
jgi:hypothetical protein